MKLTADQLQVIVENYLALYPAERRSLELFSQQLAARHVMNHRKTLPGHATGSAIVLSPDRTKILLIFHKVYGDWFQPGGHWEADDPDPWTVARREAEEETAVRIAELLPVAENDVSLPLSINSHLIPARPEKAEPAHVHHDLHYVFLAADETLTHQAAEVEAANWFALDAPEATHVQADIERLRHLKIIS